MTMEKSENQVDAGTDKASATMPTAPDVDRNHFPSRLHQMLSSLEDSDLAGACSWQPHGRVFMIRDNDLFINQVLPKWFCRLKYTSFQRQLCLYGFRKLSRKGPDQGGYYHANFIRERLDLATTIQPGKNKGKRGRRPKNDESEPNFYQTSPPAPPRQAEMKSPPPGPGALGATPKDTAPARTAASGIPVDPAFSLKEDSPDQLSLEAMMHQPQYREDIFDSRQGLLQRIGETQWPTQQSLATESHPVSTNQRAPLDQDTNLQLEELLFLQGADHGPDTGLAGTTSYAASSTRAAAASRGVGDHSAPEAISAPAWAWESLVGLEESPVPAGPPASQAPAPGLATASGLPASYTQLHAQQLLPEEEKLQLQQILERQRLRDLMDLNQAQQENLKIQQEQLEQQRLELQLRDQEQLQQLREELHARENQQLLQSLRTRETQQRTPNPGQMLAALPRPPRLFEPQRGGNVAFESQTRRKLQPPQQPIQRQLQQSPRLPPQHPQQPRSPTSSQGQSGMFRGAYHQPHQGNRGNQQGR